MVRPRFRSDESRLLACCGPWNIRRDQLQRIRWLRPM